MRLIALLLANVLICVTAFDAAAQSTRAPQTAARTKAEDCEISGTVVALAGSVPLKSAIVVLKSTTDHSRATHVTTDSDGHFRIKGINAGQYRLAVTRIGFVAQEYGQRTVNTPGAILALSPGQEMKDLVFRLIPSATISGRVQNEDGDALPWAHVSALREIYSGGKRRLEAEESVPTNDRGEYRLFGLRPGRYLIAAVYHPGAVPTTNDFEDDAMEFDQLSESYVRTFYPGSTDPAKAEAVSVKSGEEIPSMDFMLRPTPVFRVKGRVFNALATDRKKSNNIMVYLTPKNSKVVTNSFTFGPDNTTKPDGTFDLPAMPPGSYVVNAEWSNDGKRHIARQDIEISDADVEGLQLTIAKGPTVTGHVRWDGGSGAQTDDLSILAEAPEDEFGRAYARVEADGSFSLSEVAAGALNVTIESQPPNSYIKSIDYGGVDVLEDGFTARAGSNATLEIVLGSRGAQLKGGVSDAEGLPVVGVWVVLVPDAPHNGRHDLYKNVRTDQHGQFAITGIAPGDYRLFSWDEVEDGAWQDPDFVKSYEKKGEKIGVQAGDTKSASLLIIRTADEDQPKP